MVVRKVCLSVMIVLITFGMALTAGAQAPVGEYVLEVFLLSDPVKEANIRTLLELWINLGLLEETLLASKDLVTDVAVYIEATEEDLAMMEFILSPENVGILTADIEPQLDFAPITEPLVPIMDKHFTSNEIVEMLAYYESSIGFKQVNKMPYLLMDFLMYYYEAGKELLGSDGFEAFYADVLGAIDEETESDYYYDFGSPIATVIENYLQLNEIAYDHDAEAGSYNFLYIGLNRDLNVYVLTFENQVVVLSTVAGKVPAERRGQIAELITRINYDEYFGNFEMDFYDGELLYRTSIDVAGGSLTYTMFDNLLFHNTANFDFYYPAIQDVVRGFSDPEQALVNLFAF